jgi:hypothetical protein
MSGHEEMRQALEISCAYSLADGGEGTCLWQEAQSGQ